MVKRTEKKKIVKKISEIDVLCFKKDEEILNRMKSLLQDREPREVRNCLEIQKRYITAYKSLLKRTKELDIMLENLK